MDLLKKTFNTTATVVALISSFIAFMLWGENKHLEWAVGNMTLKEINLSVVDQQGNPVKEASINIEPMYSFDEVKPKYKMTILGQGEARISIAFSRHFKMQIGGKGYQTKLLEFSDDDSTDLSVKLNPSNINKIQK